MYRTGDQSEATPGEATSSAPALPPQLDHTYVVTSHQRRVDTLRRAIYALDAQRVLVFMNYQHRLKVQACSQAVRLPVLCAGLACFVRRSAVQSSPIDIARPRI